MAKVPEFLELRVLDSPFPRQILVREVDDEPMSFVECYMESLTRNLLAQSSQHLSTRPREENENG